MNLKLFDDLIAVRCIKSYNFIELTSKGMLNFVKPSSFEKLCSMVYSDYMTGRHELPPMEEGVIIEFGKKTHYNSAFLNLGDKVLFKPYKVNKIENDGETIAIVKESSVLLLLG